MPDRKIPGSAYDSETRNKILDETTKFIALKGFGAVSMREIAKATGIKTSSIYHHYDSKDALMADILARFESGYRHYIEWLAAENRKADSLEKVMDNMFNKEFTNMLNPMACLGMSIAVKEQHNNELARSLVFDLFFQYSIQSFQAAFDSLAEKGVIPPGNTRIIATLLMFFVLVSNDIRVHEYIGAEVPVDCAAMYGDLRKTLTAALQAGN